MTSSIKVTPKLRSRIEVQNNNRNNFDLFAKQHEFKSLNDWYKVDKLFFEKAGGSLELKSHQSLYHALKNAYPEHEWLPWKFERVPRGFWRDLSNQRWFFDWLGKELGVKQLDDWYQHLSNKHITDHGGVGLLHMHNNSLFNTLKTVYPYHNWLRWNFDQAKAPADFWASADNYREYFDWLGRQLGVKHLDDWYTLLTRDNMTKYRGSGITRHSSLYTALMEAYPEHNWLPWKFDKTYASFWKELSNQKKFLEWLSSELEIRSMDDWYKVTASQVAKKGGSGLLSLHRFSMHSVLSTVYPDYPWKPWNFEKISRFWMKDSTAVRAFIAELADQLHVVQLDDWYRVSALQLTQLRALPRIKSLGGLSTILTTLYPDYDWDTGKFFIRAKRSSQRWMMIAVKKLFPAHEVKEDYLPSNLKFEDTDRHIQLDVFVPALNLAFEYQGKQHYTDVSFFGTKRNYQDRDSLKREICVAHGITLIEVPYWWDGQLSSLAATIASIRKDISFPNEILRNAKPISSAVNS